MPPLTALSTDGVGVGAGGGGVFSIVDDGDIMEFKICGGRT